MVSTEKCYNFDNTPVLHGAVRRGEYLYQVRVYMQRASFLAASAGNMRLRVLLGFIEARAVVIDAVIKNEDTLHYLSVVCSSSASPAVFSQIMKKTAPTAIIEQMERWQVEESVSARMVRDEAWSTIPYAPVVHVVHESRRFLISLLLEYRALICDVRNRGNAVSRQELGAPKRSPGFVTPVLLFESGGEIFGIPEFQVERISEGANGSFIIQLQHVYGQRLLVCEDLLVVRDVDVLECVFLERTRTGAYLVSLPSGMSGPEDHREASGRFNLVIPALM